MNTRTRNLAAAGVAALVVALFLFRPQTPDDRGVAVSLPEPAASRTEPAVIAPPSPVPSPAGVSREMVTHALDVSRLNGFPPDASPGDVFDIWVAWNPPVAKGPNVQLLLKGVALEKVAPPVTPDGPYVAFLLVNRSQARDLLYGTKYGLLSVTQPAS
jgi:hypothetical protein